MFFTRWFRHSKQMRPSFRPSLCLLEDRTVPSGLKWWLPTPGPATHLEVETPHIVKVGREFFVEVEAKDASNHLATGYLGTVHFTLGTTDAGAVVPADYKFVAADHGVHFFPFTLGTTGSQTITATDTATASITGSAQTTVNPAPAAT